MLILPTQASADGQQLLILNSTLIFTDIIMEYIQIGGEQKTNISANLIYKNNMNGIAMLREKIAILISIISIAAAVLGLFFLLLS